MGQMKAGAPVPVALTIAGSDSIGGAGAQADLKTFAAMGCHGASAITAITAQNTHGVRAAEAVSPRLLAEQIDAIAEDASVAATKTGMLGSAEAIETVARAVERHRLTPLVVDPVMIAKSGALLIDDAAVEALAELLLPLATVITPNRHEAGRLLEIHREGAQEGAQTGAQQGANESVRTVEAASDAARAICRRYDTAVCVITGIRRVNDAGEAEAVDICAHGEQVQELAAPWHERPHVHGSGCAYSAAITAALAQGADLEQAMQTAKALIGAAIAKGIDVGSGAGRPVNPLAWRGWR